MKYRIRHTKPHLRYISITATLENIDEEMVEIQLPSWRPGRYELGNFAKNVRNFIVTGLNGDELPALKITKDLWQVQTRGNKSITISYEYYAALLDAGSTYTDEDILYVNPVNCLVYDTARIDDPCELTLDVPGHFTVACALPLTGKTLTAKNYDELADSPLIAAKNIEHYAVDVDGVYHHIWLSGRHTLDVERFLQDVKTYTREQVKVFNEFPSTDFHYLVHFLPGIFRHGVEHSYSTVIAIGPGEDFNTEDRHNDLLAICCHELFHFWNVKRLRPAAMMPYNYAGENYSTLGYIYEGVTTYYGDYLLLRSGVWDFDEYNTEASKDLQRHFDSRGRYNYSVADSSFDTWLDGYTNGTPGRKVSIYVEGMLAAWIVDIILRDTTGNKASLDTAMRTMYDRCYKAGKGYTEEDYIGILEELSGADMEWYFRDIIWGKGNIEKLLPAQLDKLGLEIVESPSVLMHERLYGFKLARVNGHYAVSAVAEGSPADEGGVAIGSTVLEINGKPLTTDTLPDEKITADAVTISLHTIHTNKTVTLHPQTYKQYYNQYFFGKKANATAKQKEFYKAWSNNEF